MAFLRRKSGVYHEDVYSEDFDIPRSRRRLSKPLTNSATNLTSLSQQQRRKSTGRSGQDDASPLTPVESRDFMKSRLFSLTSEADLANMNSKGSQVALLAARFEKNGATSASASQLSLSSAKTTQRSLPQNLSRKTSVDQHDSSSDNSWGKSYPGNLDMSNVSPMSSLEGMGDDSAPPARRAASFIPGAATRAPSQPQETIHEETASLLSSTAMRAKEQNIDLARSSTHEEWTPPPQNDRPVTPSDLEYAHIGRLGLGSLRVVNGAVSPAPSEMLRMNKNHAHLGLRRDCSSVYAESEIGTVKSKKAAHGYYPESSDLATGTRNLSLEKPEIHRAFSFNPGAEAVLSQSKLEPKVDEPSNKGDGGNAEYTTEFLADDYIAELPTSPYAVTPPESPRIVQIWSQVTIEPLQLDASLSELSKPVSNILDSPPVTPASQGSVVRHAVQPNNKNLFYREQAIPVPDGKDRPDSPASFFSMPDTDHEADNFKSAVEIQPIRSRSRSPQKIVGSPLKEAHRPVHMIPRRPLPSKLDSGYSSEVSTRLPPLMPDASTIQEYRHIDQSPERRALRLPFRKAVQSPNKPILIQPTPSMKVPTPFTAQIESISALTSVTSLHNDQSKAHHDTTSGESVSLTKTKDKLRKKLQKQRRKSTAEPVREVVVQRIVSMECFDIPVISHTARTSLAQRAEVIPELQATYKTQDHTVRDPNASVLTLAPSTNVEFPAPAPVKEEQRPGRSRSQSRTRKRSLSRPRSWFGWSKEEKVEPRSLTRAEVSEHLNDFGTVVGLLGTDPYDIARVKPQVTKAQPRIPSPIQNLRPELIRRRTSPSNLVDLDLRPRSMMDDESAQKVAKQRRLSNAEKRATPTSRHSFDDRGGIPGKIPQSVRLSLNAPPLPPLPSADEINRRYSCKLGLTPPTSTNTFEQDTTNHFTQGDAQAPPPPTHSPSPEQSRNSIDGRGSTSLNTAVYSNQQFDSPVEHQTYDVMPDGEIAPPPPSHSPHPIDVTERVGRQRDVSWTGPANAWYARRRSASANLQDAYIETGHYQESIPRRPISNTLQAYPDMQYTTMYDVPGQNDQFMQPQGYSTGYDMDFYEDIRPLSQQNTLAGDYEPWNGPHSQDRWDEEKYQQYHQFQSHQPTREYYPDNSGYNSHSGPEQFHPRLTQRHTWQPTPQGYENSYPPGGQRFYAEYNKGNIPYPDHAINRRAQTFDEYPRPASQRSKRSRSRSQSRPNSRHSHYSRPTSRHSQHSQHFGYPSEEMPFQPMRSDRSPRHDRNTGRMGYDPRLLPARFDGMAEEHRRNTNQRHDMSAQKNKRSSWLDMEAYGIDFDTASGRQMPIRSPVDRMPYP